VPKYSVSLIIPKSDKRTLDRIKTAIQAVYTDGEGKLKEKGNGKTVSALAVLKTPLRDGDTERPNDEAYTDSYFINANSVTTPGIVDNQQEPQPITVRSEIYSGVYAKASVNFYAFNSNGNKGITCGLNNIQKLRNGEPLDGKLAPRTTSPQRTTTISSPETVSIANQPLFCYWRAYENYQHRY
jgi:hypothetical protein